MPASDLRTRPRSRSATFLLAGAGLTIPAAIFLIFSFGDVAGLVALVIVWVGALVWLVRKRREDPSWVGPPPD